MNTVPEKFARTIVELHGEAGALLRNPMPQLLAEPHPRRILARRMDQLAEELGFDRARLAGWGLAQAVLAAWWSYEDHGHGWEPWIACAEILATEVLPGSSMPVTDVFEDPLEA